LRHAPPGHAVWRWTCADSEAFLHAGGAGCRLFDRGHVAVLIRGSVTDTWSRTPSDLGRLSHKLVEAYLEHGSLHIDGLEGCFTLALIDGKTNTVLVYRNLVGDHNAYYHESGDGLLIGSNLADLADACRTPPRPNNDDLPTLFLNRTIPGRNTLFAGCHRLMPGEQLTRKGGPVFLVQRQTFGDLR